MLERKMLPVEKLKTDLRSAAEEMKLLANHLEIHPERIAPETIASILRAAAVTFTSLADATIVGQTGRGLMCDANTR